MSNTVKPTENEHFVPKVYLKNFAIPGRKKDKYLTYQFDTLNGKCCPPNTPVDTEKICYKEHSLEYRQNGKIIATNLNERYYSKYIEPEWNNIVKTVQNFIKPGTPILWGPLRERIFEFMTLQQMRHPEFIAASDYTLHELFHMNEQDAHNTSLLFCTPTLFHIEPGFQKVFKMLMERALSMSCAIGIAPHDEIICNDNTVVWIGPEHGLPTQIVFPITSSLVLFLDEQEVHPTIFKMHTAYVADTNRLLAQFATRWVYSRHPFTDKQQKDFTKRNSFRVYGASMRINRPILPEIPS